VLGIFDHIIEYGLTGFHFAKFMGVVMIKEFSAQLRKPFARFFKL
jgi:hypothetical protein